jgi:uncharacterized protein involved in type VI secretion and phage assembly
MVVVDRPVESDEEAKKLAQSILDEISGEYLEAEGLCFAQPKLRPGMTVNVKNVGSRYTGTYFVTSTNHTYTPAEGYLTQFSVSGKQPSTLLAELDPGSISDRRSLGEQIVIGVVTNLRDPLNLGRVKVNYPWLLEEDESDWVRQASPMAGKERGFQFTPEIGDEVLVAFEHGDIHRPFIIGALWNGKDAPVQPQAEIVKGDQVVHRVIKTRIGHTMLFDDTDVLGEISLTTHGEHKFVLDDKNKKITVKTKSGHELTMSDQDDTILLVDKTGSNKLLIKSSDNSITMECNGNFSLTAKGKVSIEGKQGVAINSGMTMEVKSQATMTIQSSAPMSIKGGPTVSINT